jgi:hypothetical protein
MRFECFTYFYFCRAGKQPSMEIAIRQIEQLRTQLEESQDYIVSIQEEANEDRQYYRNRLNSLFSRMTYLEKMKDYSFVLVKKIEQVSLSHSLKDEELEEVDFNADVVFLFFLFFRRSFRKLYPVPRKRVMIMKV